MELYRIRGMGSLLGKAFHFLVVIKTCLTVEKNQGGLKMTAFFVDG